MYGRVEMQTTQLKEYLGKVLETERLKYQQEQLAYKVKRKIEDINQEMNRTVEKPDYQILPYSLKRPIAWLIGIAGVVLALIIMGIMGEICDFLSIQYGTQYSLYWGILLSTVIISIGIIDATYRELYFAVVPIVAVVVGVIVYNVWCVKMIRTESKAWIWFWVISILCYFTIIFCVIVCIYENKDVKESNQRKHAEFTSQREQLKRKNKSNELIRNQLFNERNQIYQRLNQTEQILERLYAFNILYPKYRGLIPVCSIYEYLCSGRCSTLEGHEGAYNIYETELRFERITNQLDAVLDKLDEIAATQKMLYDTVVDANRTTKKVYDSMNKMVESNQRIEDNVTISNYHLEVTQRNTEIIKWMQIFDKLEASE